MTTLAKVIVDCSRNMATPVFTNIHSVDQRKNTLLSYLGEQPDVAMKDTDEAKKDIVRLPEIEIYLNLLVMIYLLDNSKFEQVRNIRKNHGIKPVLGISTTTFTGNGVGKGNC
jgi:hypothetical protein